MYTCIHCLSSELYVYRYYQLHNIYIYICYVYIYICVMIIVFGSILKAFDSGQMATTCIYILISLHGMKNGLFMKIC